MMILLNFSTPFRSVQLAQAETLLHEPIDRVVNFLCQVDSDMEILPQFYPLMAKLPLNDAELISEPVVVVLPAQNYLAVLVMAYLHGRMGYFPPVIRTRLKTLGLLPLHEAAELLDPQAVEDAAK
jgi:hypothetical protein